MVIEKDNNNTNHELLVLCSKAMHNLGNYYYIEKNYKQSKNIIWCQLKKKIVMRLIIWVFITTLYRKNYDEAKKYYFMVIEK